MATTTTLLQHPLHDKQHPLENRDFRKVSITRFCDLCFGKISADGYACEECEFYAHRVCAEAPPRIYPHPLHTDHPLTHIHHPPPFECDACGHDFTSYFTSFRCDECDFNLDIRCALSTLSDRGGTQGKTPERIELPLHDHPLTSFSTRHDFIEGKNCEICKASVEGDEDGYACLGRWCEFLIHKKCIQDRYYTDGTKAPRIYHHHPLKTFLGVDMGSSRCGNCGSDESSGEFIGCAECQVFCCRDCVQVPESIQYPRHPDHTLVLLISSRNIDISHCDSCLCYCELSYGCPSCKFFVDLRCALPVLAYCEEGMSTKIKLSWHEHQLHLCHGTETDPRHCSYCEDQSSGPMYTCKEEDCNVQLHKRCTEIEVPAILQHPHHPDHQLTLFQGDDFRRCEACCEEFLYLYFSCKVCDFYLHAKCAARFPTRKHSLHEHELLHLDNAQFWECNRCGTYTNASIFRCIPCDFNLHEVCMELPRVVKSEIHWHSLTLHENYVEDDSGEYYCDKCEKSRNARLGAYVCLQCSQRWVYHIECVLPQLGKVYAEKIQTSSINRIDERIARKSGQVRAVEAKLEEYKRVLDELKQELDEMMKRKEELISGG